MSSSEVAISVRGLSKSYTIRHNAERQTTAASALSSRIRHPLRRADREEFWALRDISFDIGRGEVVGLVGRNGAGKSTLLKVLSRITTPTAGEAHLHGRVGSLLEVGTGFHQELTGRENIYLNGAVLGMRRREIARRFDEIVEFAGVERFLDTPVKRYSSGMHVRLAFAVAAHLDTDLLTVDEVLAVGDQEFQSKCLDRMRDLAVDGRTVVFVSHNLQAVRQLCGRALWIADGELLDDGDADGVLNRYATDMFASGNHGGEANPDRRPGSGEMRIVDVIAPPLRTGPTATRAIQFEVERRRPYEGRYWIAAELFDERGTSIIQCDSRLTGYWVEATDHYRGELQLRHPWLRPGRYTVNLHLCAGGVLDRYEAAISFDVPSFLPYKFSASPDASALGVVFADFSFSSLPLTEELRAATAREA